MNEIATRALYGFIYCAIVVAAVSLHPYGLLALLAVIYTIGLVELKHLFSAQKSKPLFTTATLIGVFVLWVQQNFLPFHQEHALPFLGLLFFILFVQHLFTNGSESDFTPIVKVSFSVSYLLIPMLLAIGIAYTNGLWQPRYLLGLFFIIWGNDTAAYLAGKQFGKRKLLERISPKKSIAGLFGGIAGALLIGFVLSLFWNVLSWQQWLVFAALVSLSSNVGDLFQSSLKRAAGVKDSGNLIPGHGGILDRLDSFLLSVPVVYFYLRFFT